MDNITYMNSDITGAVSSVPVTESTSNEAYMSAQAQSEPEQEEVKPYTFRKLSSPDLFPMLKIISKIGIDELSTVFDGDLIKNLMNKAREETDAAADTEQATEKSQFVVGIGVAFKIANKILEHLPSCEGDIYSLLAGVSGKTVDEIKALDLDVFLEMIVDFICKDEFKNFFKVASKLHKRLAH